MPGYRLFYFERGHIAGVRVIHSEDEALAVEEGRKIAGNQEAELWRGTERIKAFNRPNVQSG